MKPAATVFFGCLALYYLNWHAISQADTIPAPYAAFSLLEGRGFDLQGYADLDKYVGRSVVELPDGRRYSKYPPGSTLFAVPVLVPAAIAGDTPPRRSLTRRLGKLSGALASAGAAALFYGGVVALAPAGAVPATVLFAAGTSMWPVASQSSWTHGPAVFSLCAALLLLLAAPARLRARPRTAALAAGLCLGLAILSRPTTVLFAGATLAGLLQLRRPAAALFTGLGTAAGLAGLLAFNLVIHGSPLAGGYGNEAYGWTTPLHVGLPGLLVNPSRGLLVYSPALLVLPFGLRGALARLEADARVLLVFWGLAALATLLLYARWHVWWGGWCYGPRLLIETLPLLCLLFALVWQAASESRRTLRRAAAGLLALSVLVQAAGVFGYDRNAWNKAHPEGPRFTLHDTQIGAALRHWAGVGGEGS